MLIKIEEDSENGKKQKGEGGEGSEIKLVPVGFVPLHCFYISLPIPPPPPTPSFSCDSVFNDKMQSYVALGQVVLFREPGAVFTVSQRNDLRQVTTHET